MENKENYTKKELTIDYNYAIKTAFLSFVSAVIVIGLVYYVFWKEQFITLKSFLADVADCNLGLGTADIYVVLIIGMIVNTFLRALIALPFVKNGFKSMKLGVFWKKLSPYCYLKEPLKIKYYLPIIITPPVLMGFIPAILGLFLGHPSLLLFGIVFIAGSSADFILLYKLKNEDSESLYLDHPTEVGGYILQEES